MGHCGTDSHLVAGDTLNFLQKDVFANFMRVGIARKGLRATICTFEGIILKENSRQLL